MYLTSEQIEELNTAFDTMAKTEYKDPKTGEKEIVCTKEDLRQHLKNIGEEVDENVINEMISIADENGDGRVTKMEFFRAAIDETPM